MRVGQLKYIDSYQFMNSSLATLAENLGSTKCKDTKCKHLYRLDKDRCIKSLENYKITMQHYYKNYTPEQIALLCRKGVYPYEYIDLQDRFNETNLLLFHKFHDKLNSKIKSKDYERIWM